MDSSDPLPPPAAAIPGDHMRAGLGLPPTSRTATFVDFALECGETLTSVTVAFNSYGTLNVSRDNCIVVGHSLTSNSCVHEWWGAVLGHGPQFALDTSRYFVICANYLGSVYGTTGPLSLNPRTGLPYMSAFPITSIRDNVRLQRQLLEHVGVRGVAVAVGGSLGAMLALEWAASYPALVSRVVAVAGCAAHPDWAIAFGEVGRRAISADSKWAGGNYRLDDPPSAGLRVARQLAMLSYRTAQSFSQKFQRKRVPVRSQSASGAATHTTGSISRSGASASRESRFDVEGYLDYQAEKFVGRFDALSYVRLTQSLDTHDIGARAAASKREYDDTQRDYRAVLAALPQPTLIVGISSDILYPINLQAEMAALIPRSALYVIDSLHGHDSFLIEIDELNKVMAAWLSTGSIPENRTAHSTDLRTAKL